jgi:signal transduction histidine kinase
VTQLLLEREFGPLTAEQTARLEIVERTTRQMVELIGATLDLGRAERKQVRLEIRAIRVAELMVELERESEAFGKHRDVSLTWTTEEGLPVLSTDRMKLKVVLKNLIGNALKFTQQGRVHVAARAREEGVEFTVSDTGPGIPEEARAMIFEPYRQAGTMDGRARDGIGLGLYIARQLLDMVGGRIDLESEVGRGSTFRVWVPLSGPGQAAPAGAPHP